MLGLKKSRKKRMRAFLVSASVTPAIYAYKGSSFLGYPKWALRCCRSAAAPYNLLCYLTVLKNTSSMDLSSAFAIACAFCRASNPLLLKGIPPWAPRDVSEQFSLCVGEMHKELAPYASAETEASGSTEESQYSHRAELDNSSGAPQLGQFAISVFAPLNLIIFTVHSRPAGGTIAIYSVRHTKIISALTAKS